MRIKIRVYRRVVFSSFSSLCLLLAFSILYLFRNPVLQIIGIASIGAMIALSAFGFFRQCRKFQLSNTAFMFIVLEIYFLFRFLFEFRVNAAYTALQALLILFVFTVMIQFYADETVFERLVRFYSMLLYVMAAVFLLAEVSGQLRALKSVLSITTMKIWFVLFAFSLLKTRKFLFIRCLVFAAVNFILGERSATIIILLIYIAYKFLDWAKLSKRKFYALFWIVALPALALPYVYVQLSKSPLRTVLNVLSREYTGGNFFSGRNRLWDIIFMAVESKPVWGLGFGNTLFLDNNITLSTHNVYMYILLVSGLVGVVLFMLAMFSVWKRYYRTIEKETTRVVASYFLGLLVFMDFELFLITNNFVLSTFWWVLLAIPVVLENGRVRKEKKLAEKMALK